MTDTASKKYKFNTATGRTGAKKYEDGKAPSPSPKGRVPRISKLMALAIRFEKLIQDGVVENQAEIAQLGMISRARGDADYEPAQSGARDSGADFVFATN